MTPEASTPDPRPETPDPVAASDWLSPRRFALVLAVLLAVTFWRVLFGGEAFFYRDYGFLGYPFAHFHRECFWSGDFFPLWNPYVNCGAPFLAQWNTLCLYPGALIYLLLPLPWSLGFFCVAHLFLGGMGMRALAERWTGSRFGAAVAGVAFVFSGLVLGCVIYPNYLVALGWMPWVVLATRRAWREGGRSVVLAALAGAMQMLSGAPEIILMTWGFLAALVVLDWVQSPKSKVQGPSAQGNCGKQDASSLTPALSRWEREGASKPVENPRVPVADPAASDLSAKSETSAVTSTLTASLPLPAGEGQGEGERVQSETVPPPSAQGPTNHYSLITRFLSVIILITGLCTAQLFPFFQLLSLSQRSGDAVNTFWSLPGWGWVNLFFPLFMNFQTEQGVFVMIGQAFFPSVYLGIVPLTLAVLAVWRIGLRRTEGAVTATTAGALGPSLPPHPGPLPPGEGDRQSALVNDAASSVQRRASSPPLPGGEGRGEGEERGLEPSPPSPSATGSGLPAAVWEVRLLGAATLLAVLLAMGDNTPLWGWLREVLPLGIMRFPVKALLLTAFTVPLLAAWGVSVLKPARLHWDIHRTQSAQLFFQSTVLAVLSYHGLRALMNEPSYVLGAAQLPWVNLLLRGVILLLAIVWLFFQSRPGQPQVVAWFLALMLLWTDALTHLPVFNPTIPAAAFDPGLAAAYHASKGALTPAPKVGDGRIMLSPQAELALHTRMVPKFYDDFIGQRLAFWGNLNLLDGLPKVNGASTLVTREWNEVEYFLYGTTNPAPANLMDFLGVTHTTKAGELMQWERRTSAMPLVSAGQRPIVGDDSKAPFAYLDTTALNYREVVLLPSEARQLQLATNQVLATARVLRFGPRAGDLESPSVADERTGRRLQTAGTGFGAANLIEIEAEAVAPTVVVIAQNFYPSWRATVNGQPAPVFRANHAFQAVPIPAGQSTVRLDYVDWPFRLGALLSLATLLGCLVLWRRAPASSVRSD